MKKVLNIRCLMLLLMFGLAIHAKAQTLVTGVVSDPNDGFGLPGVNVLIKGTSSGTVTDATGAYQIEVPDGGILVFSFVGYQTKEVEVGSRSVVDVGLEVDIQQLSEVVVIGYGTQQKEDLTGVVTAVDSKDFNGGAIVSPENLISGKVAGVQITQNSGEPGGQTTIRIRGGTSINASNEPLFVIDGVPIDNSPHNPGGFSGGRNPLNTINPNDIETFTVLKDASATAIYGSRGANGVIIITTKKGKAGSQENFSYSGWASVANPLDQVDVLDGPQFTQVVSEQAPGKLSQVFTQDTDWQDLVTRSAIGQNHSVSFGGGSVNSGFRASIGYLNQEGTIKTSKTERLSLNLNYNQKLFDDALNLDMNIKSSRTEDRYNPGGAIGNAASFMPTQPVFDANSPWGGYWEYQSNLGAKNPVSEINQTQDFGESIRNIGNIAATFNAPWVEGLSAKLNLGFDASNGERRRFLPTTLRSQASDSAEVRIENFTRLNTLLDFYLNYKQKFGDNSLDLTAGYSYQDFDNSFPSFRAWGIGTDIFGFNNPASATQSQTRNFVLENRLISFWGRVNYSYSGKYMATFTLRRDGSSKFGPSNRWGLFPSAAVAWRIIEEPFLANSSVFSDLKIRFGWGITGNQDIIDYGYIPTYTLSDNAAQIQFGDEFINTYRPNGYDAGLKWEETTSYNLGLDFGLLDGRLNGSVELYQKNTNDLLFEVSVPALTNLTNRIITNIGEMQNRGVELSLDAFAVDNSVVKWNVGMNLAYNENEILNLDGSDDPEFLGFLTGGISGGVGNTIQILRVGQAVNSFFIYEHQLDADGNPITDVDSEGNTRDLTEIYVDQNDDGTIDDNDKLFDKNPAPDLIAGLTSQLAVNNFDLSFTLRGNFGGYVYNNVASSTGNYSRVISDITLGNMHSSVLETGFTEPQLFSDYYLEKASFIRIDNLTLGYNVPQIADRLNMRIYGTVQNLFTFTDYSGLNPEIASGIDGNIYPISRTFILGLNLDF